MRQHRFYKNELGWFIDLKWFPFNKAWLAMVEGADVLLDELSEGENEVTLEMTTTGPFPFYDGKLERDPLLPFRHGSLYDVTITNSKFDGFEHLFPMSGEKSQIWLCPATLWVFLRYPKKIWFKKVK